MPSRVMVKWPTNDEVLLVHQHALQQAAKMKDIISLYWNEVYAVFLEFVCFKDMCASWTHRIFVISKEIAYLVQIVHNYHTCPSATYLKRHMSRNLSQQ